MDIKKLKRLTNEELENYEERAAILQHEGGYDRESAENMAYQAVILARHYKTGFDSRPWP